MTEETVAHAMRLAAAYDGLTLWRNNNGACTDAKTGRLIRYGLANDSAKLNDMIKSSDFIGFRPHVVQPGDVGRVLAVFCAIETKRPGWHLTPGDDRGQAQLRFMNIVTGGGGIAGFVTGPGDYPWEK